MSRPRPPLPEGPYLVVGLARSGAAVAQVLREHGEVIGCDAGTPQEARGLAGVEVLLEDDGTDLVERVATVVKSPGVPQDAPVIARARELGKPVLGELEVAWRLLPGELLVVTGTNGKTTTTELLGAIHREGELPAVVAGNVGTPLASFVGATTEETTIVCEASSFQLEDTELLAPECVVLLNLAEDHLDRHGTVAAYRAAKLRAFERQERADLAVLPLGFGQVPGEARRVHFGGEGAELELRDGILVWEGTDLLPAAEVRLRGAHNLENAMAAAAAALARGAARGAVVEALRSFAGVRHRLEEIAGAAGVLFVNDSKATNVAAAAVGIAAFPSGVHVILGGSSKGGGFEGLREVVRERCSACYLIGEAAGRIAEDLAGTVPLEQCRTLPRALERAAAAARRGEVVLLSPACASFDQFENYEQRGDRFAELAIAAAERLRASV